MRHMKAFRKRNSQRGFHQSFRSQSAMEYLMTYGWAILIIAVVLAALFELGVFNPMTFAPKAAPGSCQVVRPDGPGTTDFISLSGECNGELPQYSGSISNKSVEWVQIPSSPTMNTAWDGGSYTITAWFDEQTPLNSSTGRPIVEEATGCTSGLWVGGSNPSEYSIVSIQWYGSGDTCTNIGKDMAGLGGIPYNKWVFLSDVFHYVPGGTGNYIAVCMDGGCNNVTWSEPSQPTDYAESGYDFEIGSWPCCSARLEGGNIADVQLYNTSLSNNQLKALYQEGIGGAPIKIQNLIGWWPLNGNTNDYSGNGNNGVPNGITYTSSWYSGYSTP